MILAHETHGSGRDVSFVHGFTQTRTSWMPVVRRLEGFRCTLIDAPGHGGSSDGTRSLPEAGADIAETMQVGGLVGYSMGARMALHAALLHPQRVTSLVLVSGTPGLESEEERHARRAADEALADRIESVGVPSFIDEWLANPMFAGLTPGTSMRTERLANTASGLADSLRHCGTGTQQNLWPQLTRLAMPVLIICGSDDAKFAAIARRMHEALSSSEFHEIQGAGHTVHLEQTEEFVSVLGRWLSTTVR